MRQAISSTIALLLITSTALGAEPVPDQSCPRPENVTAVLKKLFPGIRLTRIEGAEALRFVEAFNSDSSSTRWLADEVLIARNPQTPERARIGFFKGGCLLALVPRSLWAINTLQRSLEAGRDI
jgi:hypothetical protein